MGAPADLATGGMLADRYRLDAVLGRGGMATVHRARDLVLDRDVAVKLFPAVAEGADELERHRAEMRVLARLSHPALVTLHDAGSVPAGGPLRQTYLVMELVAGPSLAEHLLDGPMPPEHVAQLGRQLADALVTVHADGVVHRDLKPANVLLTTSDARAYPTGRGAGPTVKLADFGIARLCDGARLTATGTTLGTASYLSPEQATGSAIGPPSDVYSLGLLLLECLTGVRAFTGTMLEAAAARLTTSPEVPALFGDAWVELLTAMTAREPADRPPAQDVARRLAHLARTPASEEVDAPGRPSSTPEDQAILDAVRSPGAPTAPLPTAPLPTAPLSAAPPSTAHRSAGAAPQTPGPDAAPARRHAGLDRRRARIAALAMLVCAGGSALLASSLRDGDPPTTPAYPTVEGSLGTALADLQRSVEP